MAKPNQMLAIIDPLPTLKIEKDTTLALLEAARALGWSIATCHIEHLMYREKVLAKCTFHDTKEERLTPLSDFKVVLMRKDPPVDERYATACRLLKMAEAEGVFVSNSPDALLTFNEKLLALYFPEFCSPTLISSNGAEIQAFLKAHGHIVLKPFNLMGGQGIVQCKQGDENTQALIDLLTKGEQEWIIAQRFIQNVYQGDKRILLLNGEPLPYALNRVPEKGEFRGNLASGGTGVGATLTDRERHICQHIGPFLKRIGVHFAGIDVIDGFLTEINITSPTCVREISAAFNVDISRKIIEELIHRAP